MKETQNTTTAPLSEQAKAARRAYQKEWRNNNRDKLRATQQEWRNNNRDKLRATQQEWRKNNPDKVIAIQQRYWEKKAREMMTASGEQEEEK